MSHFRYAPPTDWQLNNWPLNSSYMGMHEMLFWLSEHFDNEFLGNWENKWPRSFHPARKAIEIGSWRGESTHIFASCGLFRGGITCIDPWVDNHHYSRFMSENETMSDIRKDFETNCRLYLKPNNHCSVRVIRDYSQFCYDEFDDNSVDFIYIDGDHAKECVAQDIEKYLPKLKKGGVIAGHDYEKRWWPGVVESVDSKLGKPDKVFMDSSWVKVVE